MAAAPDLRFDGHRMKAKRTHCMRGHELTPDNVLYRISPGTCKACAAAGNRRRYKNDPAVRAWRAAYNKKRRISHPCSLQQKREVHLNYSYGMTTEQYDTMLSAQNGVCALCLKPEKLTRMLSVDHDHITKKVRGLLCHTCNTGLGHFEKMRAQLPQVLAYLKIGDLTAVL